MVNMDHGQAKIRIEELRKTLWENSRRYYVDNAPTMSDFEYDHLMRELEDLERQYPDLQSPDSPTQRVGSDLDQGVGANAEPAVRKEFAQYPHKYPMLSLGNTYNIGEIEDFVHRAEKDLGDVRFTYSCELKFDGTAICLTYRNGVLFRALTRGDGVVGDDVTANALRISNIPERLKGSGWPGEFEIRGEVLMPYESFDRLNKEREDNEDPPFANPRNAASGSLKLLDPSEVARRGLMCTLYHIPSQGVSFATHDEALNAAASDALAGMTIVISGNFSVSRDEMKRLIEANGGRNSSSVSGKTSYLLAGSKPGPEKMKKAEELGVKVIGENEFRAMIPSAATGSGQAEAEPDLFSGLL